MSMERILDSFKMLHYIQKAEFIYSWITPEVIYYNLDNQIDCDAFICSEWVWS